MAVIQDIPPELLRSILELLDEISDVPKGLCAASLVARDWRRPSQQLLVHRTNLWDLNADHRASILPYVPARSLDKLDLYWHVSAQDLLESLQKRDITVKHLYLRNTDPRDMPTSIMDLKLLRGAHRASLLPRSVPSTDFPRQALDLSTSKDAPVLPTTRPDVKLELRALDFFPASPPPPTLVSSLLGAAPFLTRLKLNCGYHGHFPAGYTTSFKSIAPQLRQLTLMYPLPDSTHDSSFDLLRFVACGTSLRSLELVWTSIAAIEQLLAASRAPLALLDAQLDYGLRAGDNRILALVAILELHEAVRLKRWRIDAAVSCGSEWGNGRDVWEAACRARGVEPRDERRFFTGESFMQPSALASA